MREKLIEILLGWGGLSNCAEDMADYLIANGVRLEEKQATSEENKRWIPVTERLPEYGQEVLVYTGNILKPIVMGYTFWKKDYDTWLHVTHWMPLPDAPKEG